MKRIFLSLIVAVLSIGFIPGEAVAKRLGGGATSGLKRQTPPPKSPDAPAANPAAPNQAAATPNNVGGAAAAAAAPKRSWLGPIAGLAAGLGLAALFSHLGMGAEFGSLLMLLLLAIVGVVLVRFLIKRFRSPQPAGAPHGMQLAGAGAGFGQAPAFGSGSATPRIEPSVAASGPAIPAGFDAAGFERAAKMIFIRLQAANDTADLEDLRQFATPEMFAAFKLDLQERGNSKQQTDVVQLDAQVLDVAEEPTRQIVSVRFHGLIREDIGAPAAPFDEVWHLVKPSDGSREWAIAGITQNA